MCPWMAGTIITIVAEEEGRLTTAQVVSGPARTEPTAGPRTIQLRREMDFMDEIHINLHPRHGSPRLRAIQASESACHHLPLQPMCTAADVTATLTDKVMVTTSMDRRHRRLVRVIRGDTSSTVGHRAKMEGTTGPMAVSAVGAIKGPETIDRYGDCLFYYVARAKNAAQS